MIIPFLNFIQGPTKAPITWTLLILNIMVFVICAPIRKSSEARLSLYHSNSYYLQTQGAVYAKFMKRYPANYSPLLEHKANMALSGDPGALSTLGVFAFRDPAFYKLSDKANLHGDEVAMRAWRKTFNEIKDVHSYHPNYQMGFIASQPTLVSALSYQFVHANFVHLAGNLFLFALLGSYLEPVIGSLAFLLVFLSTGVAGAGVYAASAGANMTPLVGNSGAVAGMVGLFGVMFWKRPVRYFYFIMPSKGYWGWIYLPAWFFFVYQLMSDLAGYLATVPMIGATVAFSTHIGGLVAGSLIGLFVYRGSKATS